MNNEGIDSVVTLKIELTPPNDLDQTPEALEAWRHAKIFEMSEALFQMYDFVLEVHFDNLQVK